MCQNMLERWCLTTLVDEEGNTQQAKARLISCDIWESSSQNKGSILHLDYNIIIFFIETLVTNATVKLQDLIVL